MIRRSASIKNKKDVLKDYVEGHHIKEIVAKSGYSSKTIYLWINKVIDEDFIKEYESIKELYMIRDKVKQRFYSTNHN